MIKPANIILTLVGTAVVGGTAVTALRSRSKQEDDWGSTSLPSPSRGVPSNPTYPNDYFVKGLGYYHAPFHAFYPNRFNFHDDAQGYYYGGSWHPTASTSTITTSTPSPEQLVLLRQLLASGTATEEYPNNYYAPGLGYYHAPHHSFFPFAFNSYQPGRGYYYGGSWWPNQSTSNVRTSTPSTSAMSQLKRAFTTGTVVSSSTPSSSSSHGFFSGSSSSGSHVSSPSVSRGGFGSSSHGSSGSSGS